MNARYRFVSYGRKGQEFVTVTRTLKVKEHDLKPTVQALELLAALQHPTMEEWHTAITKMEDVWIS